MTAKTKTIYTPLFIISFLTTLSYSADDANVMNKFAAALQRGTAPPNWVGGTPFCYWTGIDCDNTGRVTTISLPNKGLFGKLPSELNHLSKLKRLALQGNSITGEIPLLANLSSLEELYLYNNNFQSIPSNFGLRLYNLKTFVISHNPLSPWTISIRFRDSRNLTTFSAVNTGIIGHLLPDVFGPNLQTLVLSDNNLTGVIPLFAHLTSLRRLLLNNNSFTGFIPLTLVTLPHLEIIDLSNNKLAGPVPVFPSRVNFTWAGNLFLGNVRPPPKGNSRSMVWIADLVVAVGLVMGVVGVMIFVWGICYWMRQSS